MQFKTIEDLIRDHPFFESLGDEAIAFIAGCGRNTVFKPGDYVMREGGEATHFYLIRSGSIALETFAPGRGPVAFDTVKAGDFLGVSWLVEPHRWSFDARVVEETHAIDFDAECLRKKCDADPSLGYAMMKRFVPAVLQRLKAARLQCMDLYAEPGEAGR